jgi:hypothetical protein
MNKRVDSLSLKCLFLVRGKTEARKDCADIPGSLKRLVRPTRPITNPTLASESESLARRRDAGPKAPKADFLRHQITNTTRTMMAAPRTPPRTPPRTKNVFFGDEVGVGLEEGDPMF